MVQPDRLNDATSCNAILDMSAGNTQEIFERQINALITRHDATDVPNQRFSTPPPSYAAARTAGARWRGGMGVRIMVIAIEDARYMSTMERPEAMNEAFWGG